MGNVSDEMRNLYLKTAKELGYFNIDFDLENDFYEAESEEELFRLLELGRFERAQYDRKPKKYKIKNDPVCTIDIPKNIVRKFRSFCERRGIVVSESTGLNNTVKIVVYGIQEDVISIKKYLNKKGVIA